MDIEKIKTNLENRIPSIMGAQHFTKYAVLLPLLKVDDEIHLLLEVRALSLRRQPGEICFPGGKMDKGDKNEQYTAIRETSEELGIPNECISIIAPLDYTISPFGTIIYPFVGYISKHEILNPNPSEVDKVFTVPLTHFISNPPDCFKVHFKAAPEDGFPYEHIRGGQKYKWQTRHLDEYFYYYEDYVIWGLTAGIIKQFVELLKNETPLNNE
ncbi:NUDIX hydrolase [Heyndrickxia shackletonii]|uniref:NUDIX hydrolase n=1 Tax=Heyndrickxia shackletonii TaxID=157838 RepID=A0A0Q3WXJ7_9BACI|nr:CoA pyrophosphatase [Heyndrickxia shackletonii]KQL53548.1 NUDIX hydrolase [Heyndrickxia shackletonii]MBB2482177.1 CoA pyrophosphatase [Bacillus sp. APMAM]NEY99630.1 CoA pyrophosphatase [Heyndrickxia shackletonii]RTZ54520.1 CoA pyrophosphatase [Bacillus sp. SAJ1]